MILFDFAQPGKVEQWASANDVVMGGVSSGMLERTDGGAVFHGVVRLENGGGFASVRSFSGTRDLRGHDGIEIRVRGDGKRYKLNLRNEASPDALLYTAAFDTRAGDWVDVRLAFREFLPRFRGRVVPEAPLLDRSRIVGLGLMISDRQGGAFRMEIARIAVYPDAA